VALETSTLAATLFSAVRTAWQPWGDPVSRPPAVQFGVTLLAARLKCCAAAVLFSPAPCLWHRVLQQDTHRCVRRGKTTPGRAAAAQSSCGWPCPSAPANCSGGHLPLGGIKPYTRDLGPSPQTCQAEGCVGERYPLTSDTPADWLNGRQDGAPVVATHRVAINRCPLNAAVKHCGRVRLKTLPGRQKSDHGG